VSLIEQERDFVADTAHAFADRRETRIEALADLVEEHLDTDALMGLLSDDTFGRLPKVTLSLE
jgi:adenosylcobyric acid synthase